MSHHINRLLGVISLLTVLIVFGTIQPEAPDRLPPPKAPNNWFFAERSFPHGFIPKPEWQEAQLAASLMRGLARRERDLAEQKDGYVRADWVARGPENIGGRITSLAVHPGNGSIVYAGCAEGGVLRSVDGGASFTPVFDFEASISVGAMAVDPQTPTTVYAGTGEVNPGGGSVAYGGTGLYRSLDAGDTWLAVGLENTGSIGRIIVDPLDSDRIFVAAMGDLWTEGPDRGVYRTTDGGASWDLVHFVDQGIGCVDLIQRPDQPDVLLAAMWERLRQPEAYDYGGPGCAVWRSDDGGDTWTIVGGGLPAPGVDGGRIGLSLCAGQPHVMHAVYADRTGYFDGLYRSTDGGANWTRTSDSALADVFASFGWWFGNVRTHPYDPDVIFVLGLDLFRSINGGASWSNVGSEVHVDHHGMAFGPGVSPVVYNGNDGGVYRSDDGGNDWSFVGNQPILQVYRLGLDAHNPNAIFAGAQDNSTPRTLTGALDDWEVLAYGDGFQPLVHPTDSSRLWAQYQYGGVLTSSNGGQGWYAATSGIYSADRKAWNAPHVQDPGNPVQRYFGSHRVYRSTDVASWTLISGDLTGGPHANQSGQVRGTLTTLNVSPLDGDVIWSGSDDGYVHVTENAGGLWSDRSAGLPERWITSVRCDPFIRETAYVTVSGFRWGEPTAHVYRTDDLGLNWQPVATGLPAAPVNDLLCDPLAERWLYVASDVGVYHSRNGGLSWSMLGVDLPRVVVNSLAYEPITRNLLAGTYGRSVFGMALPDPATPVPETLVVDAGFGRLLTPWPNPTGGTATLAFAATRDADLMIEVFNVAGRRLWSHPLQVQTGRTASLNWSGRDRAGQPAASGVYLVRVSDRGQVVSTKTLTLRR